MNSLLLPPTLLRGTMNPTPTTPTQLDMTKQAAVWPLTSVPPTNTAITPLIPSWLPLPAAFAGHRRNAQPHVPCPSVWAV